MSLNTLHPGANSVLFPLEARWKWAFKPESQAPALDSSDNNTGFRFLSPSGPVKGTGALCTAVYVAFTITHSWPPAFYTWGN